MKKLILAACLCLTPALAAAQDAPPPAQDAPPPAANPEMTGPKLLIQTSMGDITVQLDAVRAPKSVANIRRFVAMKHYDGTVVYRVVKGFVIQMGSWEANRKGRGIVPKPLPLEANNGLKNFRGAAALAHGDDPTSGAADFFIDLADNHALDQKADDTANMTGFAVFGQVSAGMDVVDAIAQVPVGDNGPMAGQAPVDPITIRKMTILP